MKAIDGLAFKRDGSVHVPRLQKVGDEVVVQRLFRRFMRREHELPAMAAGSHHDAGRRSGWVTYLKIDARQSRRVLNNRVDDQPWLIELKVLHCCGHVRPDPGRGAIGADEVSPPDRLQSFRRLEPRDDFAISCGIVEQRP